MRIERIKNIFLLAIVAALFVWLFIKIKSLPSVSEWFAPKNVVIQNSPVVIKQIQALSQLITVSMYEELVVDSNINNTAFLPVPLLPRIAIYNNEKILVIIGKVTTHTGIDLQKMGNFSVSSSKDSIHIILPQAEVLDAIINPSDVTVFIEKGEWSNEAVASLKNKIQRIAVADSQSRGLLMQSENKAKEILTRFFTAAGYKIVVIQFATGSLQRDE